MRLHSLQNLFLATLCLLATTPLIGQGASNGANEEPIFKVRFRVLAWEASITDLFYLQDGEQIPFLASHSIPSNWMEYRGPAPLVFYRPSLPSVDANAPPPLPIPAASFYPRASGEWLFLIINNPDPDAPPPYKLGVIPDPQENRLEGVRVLNFSSSEVAVQINNEVMRIPPEGADHLRPAPRPDNSLTMRIAVREAASWELFFSTVLEDRKNSRLTLFIEESEGKINLRRFSESLTVPIPARIPE